MEKTPLHFFPHVFLRFSLLLVSNVISHSTCCFSHSSNFSICTVSSSFIFGAICLKPILTKSNWSNVLIETWPELNQIGPFQIETYSHQNVCSWNYCGQHYSDINGAFYTIKNDGNSSSLWKLKGSKLMVTEIHCIICKPQKIDYNIFIESKNAY